ncbi:hypothetical protein [Kitasatospora sp. NBC_01300]|uniref:hypothetical protein n=1 Tax=Kitasatospora sp. NBC_01300 TaxID=2903574 RepID=UPI00352E24B5|nr:hypothetical protein OG556_40095 [Kitasatospora sp. NBC_01300]
MTSARRPLWQPFSESPSDPPAAPPSPEARLTAVERAPFLEPATEDGPAQWPAPGGRRPLGPGGLAAAGR